jgi:hypothetical protein
MKETNNVWDTQHLSQDISSELGKWFSTRLDAREVIRKHYKEINMKDNIEIAADYTDWHIKTGGFARDMTLRDHFAGLAMQAYVMDEAIHDESDVATEWLQKIAEASYEMADAMIKERAK